MRIPLLLLLLVLPALLPAYAGGAGRGDREVFKASRDQWIYVDGILGETVFENRSREDVMLGSGRTGCPSGDRYQIQQWVDGEWQDRPLPNPGALLCLAVIALPVRVEPGQRVVQDFSVLLADPLPAILRINYPVRTGCGDSISTICEGSTWVPTRPFLVVEGDLERALLERARRRGTVDVIFGLGFPANLTPEEQEQAFLAEEEMLADLAVFDVEELPGTSIGSLSVAANVKALRFLLDDPRVERLRQRKRRLQVEDRPLRRHGRHFRHRRH
jgi:hypothetical protein